MQEQGIAIPATGITAEEVSAAARSGVGWAQQVVAETVDLLALALANVGTLLDPEVVVLGGGVARSADLLVEPILQRLTGVIPSIPRLVPSPLDRRAAVLGAIMLVRNETKET